MLTLGPPRYFVPICVRTDLGFSGGPMRYEWAEDGDHGTVIVDARKPTEGETGANR